MKKAIIIPIYLRLNKPEEVPSSEGVVLAKRAIQSLHLLKDQDFTLILPVCFDPAGGGDEGTFAEMDKTPQKELGGLRGVEMFLLSSHHLRSLREYMAQGDFQNMSLLLAHALSMDTVIFIDNNEVVEDPQYLKVACDYLNQRWNEKLVGGKAR